MNEIELKLALADAAEAETLAALFEVEGPPRDLVTRYLDTPDGRLRRAGIALRLRREGDRWLQSVKSARRLSGGLSRAMEDEASLSGPQPDLEAISDPDLRARIREALGTSAPVTLFETAIARRTAVREIANGACSADRPGGAVEIALDAGEARGRGRAAPIFEAEFELAAGAPDALFALAERAAGHVPIRLAQRSKAERGFALIDGTHAGPAVRRAAAVTHAPGVTVGEAAAAILSETAAQVAANAEVVRTATEPEGPHQLRVGLRRLRAALAIFEETLGPDAATLTAEARWLGQEAGALRDLDVLAHDLLGEAAQSDPAAARLANTIRRKAGPARRRLRAALDGARGGAFLITLARACARPPDDAPAAPVAVAALDRAWRKVRRRAKGMPDLDVEARHDLRKALKGLRYAVELTEGLTPDEGRDGFLKALKRLQKRFGALNDIALMETALSGPSAPMARDAEAQRSIGRLLGRAERDAAADWATAQALWSDLKTAGSYWR